MKTFLNIAAAAALLTQSLSAGFAHAIPAQPPAVPPGQIVHAAADCRAVGQQLASQNGGTLASARAENRGGRTVCVIVVVVPPKDGQRGRREEFEVPA